MINFFSAPKIEEIVLQRIALYAFNYDLLKKQYYKLGNRIISYKQKEGKYIPYIWDRKFDIFTLIQRDLYNQYKFPNNEINPHYNKIKNRHRFNSTLYYPVIHNHFLEELLERQFQKVVPGPAVIVIEQPWILYMLDTVFGIKGVIAIRLKSFFEWELVQATGTVYTFYMPEELKRVIHFILLNYARMKKGYDITGDIDIPLYPMGDAKYDIIDGVTFVFDGKKFYVRRYFDTFFHEYKASLVKDAYELSEIATMHEVEYKHIYQVEEFYEECMKEKVNSANNQKN